MTEKKCKNCVHFDNTEHKQDKRTEHAGKCVKMAQIVFLNDSCNRMFQPVQKTLNDFEVIEPIYVLPERQMSMFDIINFISQ